MPSNSHWFDQDGPVGKTQHTSTHSLVATLVVLRYLRCIDCFVHPLSCSIYVALAAQNAQGKEHYSPNLTNAHREYSCHSCPWQVSCVLVEPSLRPSRNLNRIKVAYLTTTRQSKARHSIALSPMWRMCPQRNAAFQLFSTLLLLRKLLIWSDPHLETPVVKTCLTTPGVAANRKPQQPGLFQSCRRAKQRKLAPSCPVTSLKKSQKYVIRMCKNKVDR